MYALAGVACPLNSYTLKHPSHSHFVKKVDEFPSLDLPPDELRRRVCILQERTLVWKFMGLWPNLQPVNGWITKTWNSLVKESTENFVLGRGLFFCLLLILRRTETTYLNVGHSLWVLRVFPYPLDLVFWPWNGNNNGSCLGSFISTLPIFPLRCNHLQTRRRQVGTLHWSGRAKGRVSLFCQNLHGHILFKKGLPETIQLNVDG